MSGHLVLIKHAMPVLDARSPAREWGLSHEGQRQAWTLCRHLHRFDPKRIISSPEPKARRTAEIVSEELAVPSSVVGALREIDRPILPILSSAEHERLNAPIFAERERAVVGNESADDARARFGNAVRAELSGMDDECLAVVSHGTVISLFVCETNSQVDAFQLWRRLQCPSFVVLQTPSFRLTEVVDDVNRKKRG